MKEILLWFSVFISCGLSVINASVPITCPSGSIDSNGQCVVQECKPGSISIGGQCIVIDESNPGNIQPTVCHPGFKLIGERCVKFVQPTSPQQPAVCRQGSVLIGGQCIQVGGTGPQVIQPNICHHGSILSGGQCIQVGGTSPQIIQPTICQQGSVMGGGQCIHVGGTSSQIIQQPTMCQQGFSQIIQQPSLCQQSVCAQQPIYQQPIQQIPCAPTYPPYILPTPVPTYAPTHPPVTHNPPTIDKTIIYVVPSDESARIETLKGESDTSVTLSLTNVINVNNTIHAPVNVTNHNVVNTPVYISESRYEHENSIVRPITPDPPRPLPPPIPSPSRKCCSVISPRICSTVHNQIECSHRKYHRCGEFCVAPKIYLRTHTMRNRDSRLFVPPIRTLPRYRHRGTLDCSGCMSRQSNHCSQGCYSYDCNRSRGCQYQDQEEFCSEHGGDGCTDEDGYEGPTNESYEDMQYTIN